MSRGGLIPRLRFQHDDAGSQEYLGLPTLFRAANNEETAVWEKLAGPIAVRLLPRDSYLRSAIEGLFRIGAMDLAPEECLGTVLDGRTASDGRDQTVIGFRSREAAASPESALVQVFGCRQ
jgi:hypothetical protein